MATTGATTGLLGSFDELLQAARQQDEPQRLLFVFAERELGADASAAQRERFERGEGGHLQPRLCVDKTPEEIASFAALCTESEQTGMHWDVVFVSTLSGRGGIAPGSDAAEQPLRFMVNAINGGRLRDMVAFDRSGHVLRMM